MHRIGRTGRAGRGGITIAFCDENEGEYLRGIEKMIRQDIPVDEDHPFHSEKARSRKGNKAPKKQQNRGRGPGADLAMANPRQSLEWQIKSPTPWWAQWSAFRSRSKTQTTQASGPLLSSTELIRLPVSSSLEEPHIFAAPILQQQLAHTSSFLDLVQRTPNSIGLRCRSVAPSQGP
ncbi:MAG: hypothetical protein CM1200mP32_09650 [Methanobacteriota archaeon]|nr:MAG: hypothetical protein CM1200mP32_09650 [Euryarchaeota archaeon]